MIARYWRRLAGNVAIAAQLRGQRTVPFLARPALDELRDQRIRDTVIYATRAVPYYREWFAREGIDPRDVTGAADLDRLPMLDKDLVRSQPRLFVAETAAAQRASAFSTSGTTGTPIEIHHDRRSLLANIAYGERERTPVIAICGGGFRPKELYVGYETSTFKKVQAFYEENSLLPVRPRRRFVSLLEPIERIAAIANAERPDVLVGYGGWLDVFFKTIAARGINLHPPKMVMYMGEALPRGARDCIEGRFGVPVLSRYNAVEAFKIGFFCEHRTGFHLHEDLCHVRIVGPDGRSAVPGQQGEVVISNLVNRATVLLNYPIGDAGTISTERCPCGRTFALLSELDGRVEDIIALPDGRFVHPRTIWQVFKGDSDIFQYQLTQHDAQRFVLTLVTLDEAGFQRARARSLPALAGLLGTGVMIDATRRSEVDRGTGGKFRAVIACQRS